MERKMSKNEMKVYREGFIAKIKGFFRKFLKNKPYIQVEKLKEEKCDTQNSFSDTIKMTDYIENKFRDRLLMHFSHENRVDSCVRF